MASDLEVRRLLVDSRYRSSGSSSNFTFDLPQTVSLPQGAVAFITDVLIPSSWYTVEAGVNDRLYMEIPALAAEGQQTTIFTVVPEGSYDGDTLKTALQAALNARLSNLAPNFGVTYTQSTNKLSLTCTHDFKVHADSELKSLASLAAFYNPNHSAVSPSNPQSLNLVLGVSVNVLGLSLILFPDIRQYHQVLINSSSLGSLKTLGPNGSQTCIKRVPITAPFGGVTMYDAFHALDYIECELCTLSRLHFFVTDIRGQEINLHGAPVSFSIFFTVQ
jgi:hypothetical protein